MTAQLVHAAGESVRSPLLPGTNAVVLSVQNESELRSLSDKLHLGGIDHILITEVDAPYTDQATAIGISPVRNREEVKKFLSSLPLYR